MASIGKLYGQPEAPKVLRVVAAAKVNGAKLDVVPTNPPADTQKPAYRAKFPMGKVPGFEAPDGWTLSEGSAILTYVAGLSDNAHLNGTCPKSAARVNQWVSFTDDELHNNAVMLIALYNHLLPYNKAFESRAWSELHRAMTVLNDHFVKQTFVVGHRLTAADLAIAAMLYPLFTRTFGEQTRSKYPHVLRYYNTIVNQRAVGGVIPVDAQFAAADAKYVAPRKEEKPKKAAGAGAGTSGSAAAAGAAPAKDEEKPAAKPKNPLDELPKSDFVIDEWKRVYSNEDTRSKALPWFYEHFDPQGFSVWRFDFKYNDELTHVFMSSNQISGLFTRLEATRKYVMGTAGVFGKTNDSAIAGVVVLRGQEWEPVLSVAPDIESYTVSRLDLSKPEDKKFFEDMLDWAATIDGKEWADGKILK
ncbi:hypothetical protein MSPP1_000579 [Malassezia sp. CBS 17886]|nr:hypothetical protein MSPP1_000579 [Malassezia sp. CBS 17886]